MLHLPGDKINDYVLGLLDNSEQQRLEQHTAQCDRCRSAVQQERQLASTMRETLQRVTQIGPSQQARLMQMMPTPPTRRPIAHRMQHSLAAASLAVMLLIGGLGIQQMGSNAPAQIGVPTQLAMTATHSAELTATATQIANIQVTPSPEMMNSH